MRLGLLTAPFPDTPLSEVSQWAGASGFESLEIACWPPARGQARRYAGTSHIDVTDLSEGRAKEIVDEVSSHGLSISGLGYYPNPMHPDPAVSEAAIAHMKLVIEAAAEDGRALLQHVHGRRRIEARRRQLGDGARRSGPRSSTTPTNTA